MKIQVEVKNVYGNQMVYPFCKKAKQFAEIIGKKTLTPHAIHIIQEMGYELEVVHNINMDFKVV